MSLCAILVLRCELVGAISDALSVCADGGQQQEMFGESVDL